MAITTPARILTPVTTTTTTRRPRTTSRRTSRVRRVGYRSWAEALLLAAIFAFVLFGRDDHMPPKRPKPWPQPPLPSAAPARPAPRPDPALPPGAALPPGHALVPRPGQ